MTDDRIRQLHEHLVATQERPVDREASRWIGEAEAVAGDLVGGDVEPTVAARRLAHVRDLLAEVDSTDDAEADEHVAAAQDLTADLLDSLPDEDAG